MTEKIKQMGMHLTEEEHAAWHARHDDMTPEEHERFLRQMGVSEEEDRKWHEAHGTPAKASGATEKPINPFAVGGGFLSYCVRQGWLIQEGKGRAAKYFATEEGRKKFKEFNIDI